MSGMYRHRLKGPAREKSQDRRRNLIQLAAAVLFNGYAVGFAKGRIFSGKTKLVCLPVLNCYSCPGALGSCPIGALQAVVGGVRHSFSFYVLGTLMLFGVLLGRLSCGFLCPFGWVQDLLGRLSAKKLKLPPKADRLLRLVKYGVLAGIILALPLAALSGGGTADPFFCKYICPAGTLQGGLPHMLLNGRLRELAGLLFGWKLLLLVAILSAAVFIPRCFCRYLCPLGAFYALFNRFSLYQMHLDRSKCLDCRKCERVCPMAVQVTANINSGECIRCGKCQAACPAQAISSGLPRKVPAENISCTARP